MSKEQNSPKQTSFWERPDVIKFKGAVKVAFGGLVILQPYYALLIGGAICAGGIGSSVYNKLKKRSWSEMRKDFKDGTFWKELKDTLGMGAGSSIGLLSPVTGLVVAGFGALSYLAGYGEGVEGLFKGGVMASTVAMTLPVIGAAFILEGLTNAVTGKEYNLIGKAVEFSKGIFQTVTKVIGIAENSKEAPSKAVEATYEAYQNISSKAKEATKEAKKDLENQTKKINKNINKSNIPKESKNWAKDALRTLTHPQDLFKSKADRIKEERSSENTKRQK